VYILAGDVVQKQYVPRCDLSDWSLRGYVTQNALGASPELAVRCAIVGFYAVATDSQVFQGKSRTMRRRSIGRTSESGTVPNNGFVGGFQCRNWATGTDSISVLLDEE